MNEPTQALAAGILSGERHCLARAITLIESSKKEHRTQAKYLLEYLAKSSNASHAHMKTPTLRIGIAGPPGTLCDAHSCGLTRI
jgi:LAO/AO transport system kinase